jgi:carboxymethylenebutenolidase
MSIKYENVRYGDQVGFFAAPERPKGPLPGVIVIQEIMGLNEHIEDVTRRIAAAGYAALAPDLFAVNGERPAHFTRERLAEAWDSMRKMPPAARLDPAVRAAEMAKIPEPDRSRIAETQAGINGIFGGMAGFVPSLRAAFRYLVGERPETKGQKVACVGFCMGGGLSALLACEEPELAGAAVFYGNSPEKEKAAAIRCPVIAFYGGEDARVNAGVPAFEEALRTSGRSFEKHVYAGANHAFFNDGGPSYDEAAVRDSYPRLLSFFAKVLTG